MATRTNVIRRFNDPVNPAIEGRFELDWDDVSNRITARRCVNPTSLPFWARATPLVDPTVSAEQTYPANSGTTVTNVPGSVAAKWAVTITNGKLDGVVIDTAYPAPGA